MSTSTVKIVIVGESSVGKTALLRRFVDHSFAPEGLKSTIGADFKAKKVAVPGHDGDVSMQIWDTAGQERFRSISNTYFRGCEGAMVVYDITSRASFDRIGYWLEELLRGTGRTHLDGFSVFVVGNKTDMAVSHRQVKHEEAKQWCQAQGLSFLEVSAKDGTNVDPAFLAIAASALDYRENMGEDMKALLDPVKPITMGGAGGGQGAGGASGSRPAQKKKGGCCK